MAHDWTDPATPPAICRDAETGERVPFVRWYDPESGTLVRYLTCDLTGQVVRGDDGHACTVCEDRRLVVEFIPEDGP
jgi:hypothetical protein